MIFARKTIARAASALGMLLLFSSAHVSPASAQTSFFSDMARECDGIYREGLNFVMKTDLLKEASGIAVSRKHPNVLWMHNDGMPQKLAAVTTNPGQEGLVVSTLSLPDYIKPASGDGDWEDISSGECPDGSGNLCLWIADIGDNEAARDSYFVYAVKESPVNPIVVYNDPLEDEMDEIIDGEEEDLAGRKLMQFEGRNTLRRQRAGAQNPSYLGWIVNQARSGRGVGDDAHERFGHAVHDPVHYNQNGDKRGQFQELTEEQMQELRKCEPDHKFLIENYVAPNDAWVFEFKYPEGVSMDSESFAVSPNGDKFWVIEKTTASSARVFESESLLQTNGTEFYKEVPVKQVSVLSPPCFASGLGCPEERVRWSITGMDVHPQGYKAVVQTYAGPYEYTLESPFDLSSMSSSTPVGGFTDKGAESIGYGLDGMTLWQVPEDSDEVGCQYMQPLMCTFTATGNK
jgi:hypothetical protein